MGRLIRQGSKGGGCPCCPGRAELPHPPADPLDVDGDFGPLTHARVVEFQKSNQLSPDGIVGPNTMAKLFEEEKLPITLVLQAATGSAIGGPHMAFSRPA